MSRKKVFITLSLLFMSIVFIVIGVIREEHLDIMRKAVNICLECIGIG